MAGVTEKLTIAEFDRQYGDRKPRHEYWFGEAIPKALSTWAHGMFQVIIAGLVREAGYRVGTEVKLRISSDFEPVPDVIATLGHIEQPYPTQAFDVVVELLSPNDPFPRTMRKCKLYGEWGIVTIVVLDPEGRSGWVWDMGRGALISTNDIALPNGRSLSLARAFAELENSL